MLKEKKNCGRCFYVQVKSWFKFVNGHFEMKQRKVKNYKIMLSSKKTDSLKLELPVDHRSEGVST